MKYFLTIFCLFLFSCGVRSQDAEANAKKWAIKLNLEIEGLSCTGSDGDPAAECTVGIKQSNNTVRFIKIYCFGDEKGCYSREFP